MQRAERAPHYRGDLRQTALPEMLAIIDRTRVTGVIRAVHGQFVKSIDLDDGYVVHATSSDIGDSLGSFLRRSGQLNEEQFHGAMQQRSEGVSRLGEVLIQRGLLTPAQVYQAIREHIEGILWSLFSWEEGEVTFALGALDPTDRVRIQIPLRQVIVQGIKRATNAKSIVQRMGGKDVVFQRSFRLEDLIELALEGEEYQLLTRVDGRRSLYQLCTGGPVSSAEAARLLYAFSVLGLVRRAAPNEVPERSPHGIKIKMRSDR
jgi:hypothetical protein